MKKLAIICSIMLYLISAVIISAASEEIDYLVPPEGYNGSDFEYQYEIQEYGNTKLVGMTYNNINYKYIYDNNGIIVGVANESNEQIAKYTYDQYGIVSQVFSRENDVWVENASPTFIGNLNKMLFTGMYFDSESQCYYVNDRYFNPVLDKYMDGEDNTFVLTDSNPFLNSHEEGISIAASDESDLAAMQWAESLLANSQYGRPISYSSSWYTGLSDVEVVARAIFCEGGTTYTNEESAVAWVILNRIHANGFDNTASNVVKAPSQFSSITGGSSPTVDARQPATNTTRWEHATYLACLLLTTTSKSEWYTIVGDKIDDQLYFYSYSYAKNLYNNGNSAFTGTTSSTLKYNGNSIKDVYVLGYGNVTSFNSLFNNYSPVAYSRNIYYNY